ncbi:MAG: hypothetical protein RL038_119 [Actinomycetota bacterium]
MGRALLQVQDVEKALDVTISKAVEGPINNFVTDSRKVTPGDIFVALVGENFNGHDFLNDAFSQGAIAAVVTQEIAEPHFLVADTLLAYGKIAAAHRAKLKAKVIGVTGSSGKTSTKDLLSSVLSKFGNTVAPSGSFNNEIGMPATILSADLSTEYLVLEMGMRGLGQISYLCEIAKPDIGVVLNIGSAHMELLGSRAAIAEAKTELVLSLDAAGTAIINADEPLILSYLPKIQAKVLTFGEAPSSDIRVDDIALNQAGLPEFEINSFGESSRLELQLAGEHQAMNAAAVVAVTQSLDLDFAKVVDALAKAEPTSSMRMQVVDLPNGITIINDAYNANPESMRAGLKALKAMAKGRRTWAVLGEMRELGQLKVEAHDEIGRLCVRLDINRLVAVGEAGKILQIGAAQEGSWGNEAQWEPDVPSVIAKLKKELQPGDIVYIKASRAIGLERVAEALISEFSAENSAP